MLQILINGLISGLLLSLVALGFHIIFKTTNIFHIAHGALYVIGAYICYWLIPILGLISGLFCALASVFILGMIIELIVYKPISKKSNNQNIALISSLAVYLIIINLIAIIAGNEIIILDNTIRNSMTIGNIVITKPQFWQIITAISVIVLFLFANRFTGLGLKIRAVADNPTLAKVIGIHTSKIRFLVFGIGSAMAAVAAILKGYDTGIDPYSGMSITLSAAVVVIVGGNYTIYGTLIVSLLLAIIQNYTEYFLSAEWKEPITFAILILVLLWRTEGILQFNNRADEK
jgi:branched-chain amino acid transport system permease protein